MNRLSTIIGACVVGLTGVCILETYREIHRYHVKDNIRNGKDRIIVRYGWTGAGQKDMDEKVIDECNVVDIIVSPLMTAFGDHSEPTARVSEILHRYHNIPVYLMFYSGGGALHYPHALDKLIKSDDIDVRGVIFDSSPVPGHKRLFYDFVRDYTRLGAAVAWPFLRLYFDIYAKARLNNYIHAISTDRINSLFIHSKADPLTPSPFMKEVIGDDSKTSVLVLEESGHLEHDTMYPELYSKAVSEFIDSTSSDNDSFM
jgi:hypothetical protein